jgi:hypothetical protein
VEDLQPGDRLYFDMKRSGRINHWRHLHRNGYFITPPRTSTRWGWTRSPKRTTGTASIRPPGTSKGERNPKTGPGESPGPVTFVGGAPV